MQLKYRNNNNKIAILEEDHEIFQIYKNFDDKLLKVTLCNSYGSESLQFYQIKKWYSKLKPDFKHEFTIYEDEQKIGKLVKSRGCYFLFMHGVKYSIYAGTVSMKREMICFDRDLEIADFNFNEDMMNISRNYQSAIFSSIYYIFKEIVNPKSFSQDLFLRRYNKVYKRDVFTQTNT